MQNVSSEIMFPESKNIHSHIYILVLGIWICLFCQVENASCEFLAIHGEDDRCVSPIAAKEFPRRLEAHGKHNYKVLLYPGAGHLIEPPYSPHAYASYNPVFGRCEINHIQVYISF